MIDHQQQVVFFRQACLAVRFGDPQCAALQGDQGEGGLHGIAAAVLIEDAGTVEGFRQITDGIAPGTHDGNPPVGAGSGHHSSQDVRQQAGAHQGGFAAAGRADHRQEALVAQPGQQFIALPVTTKEEEIFIRLKRSQTGVGEQFGSNFRHAAPPFFRRIWLMNSSRSWVVNCSNCLINDASRVRKRSLKRFCSPAIYTALARKGSLRP